jgi:hypothetical protein
MFFGCEYILSFWVLMDIDLLEEMTMDVFWMSIHTELLGANGYWAF